MCFRLNQEHCVVQIHIKHCFMYPIVQYIIKCFFFLGKWSTGLYTNKKTKTYNCLITHILMCIYQHMNSLVVDKMLNRYLAVIAIIFLNNIKLFSFTDCVCFQLNDWRIALQRLPKVTLVEVNHSFGWNHKTFGEKNEKTKRAEDLGLNTSRDCVWLEVDKKKKRNRAEGLFEGYTSTPVGEGVVWGKTRQSKGSALL